MLSKIRGTISRYRRERPTAPLQIRLTAMFAASIAFILALMGVLTGLGIYYILYSQAEFEMEVSEKHVLERLSLGVPLDQRLLLDDPLLPGVVLRVTDDQGYVILENDARYPSISVVRQNIRKFQPFWQNETMDVAVLGHLSLYYKQIAFEREGKTYRLHFMKTITAERHLLASLQYLLLAVGLSGMVLASTLAFFTVKRALDKLEEGFKRESRFTSDASHELRTPVTVILGFADMLSRWGKSDPQILEEAVESIRAEAENMQQLIEKLLFLARADQKRLGVVKERLDISEILADVVKKTALVASEHEVVLRENDPSFIYADKVMMRQMLRIFLDNSRKYTPQGGMIILSSKRRENRILLTIADTGIGISEEDLPKVFERFFRVDSARSKEVPGSGLGLAIAKYIAAQHDIEISLDSKIGEGTTVTLTIPTCE